MVSVIIPVYNVEAYVKDCLQSFENQTYRDFELLIINDGSTDQSREIIRDFISGSDMTIHLIDQENAGVSAARNAGLERAQGDYICFADSDDMVTSEYLGTMVDVMKKTGCDLMTCGAGRLGASRKLETSRFSAEPQIDLMTSAEALERLLFKKMHESVWSKMARRDLILKNNLSFVVGCRYAEDLEFTYRMLAYAKKVAQIRDELYLYRIRDDSATGMVDDRRLDGLEAIKALEGFFADVRPDFSPLFGRYGVARWIWATLWQIAMTDRSYREFASSMAKYDASSYMRKLVTFPQARVSTSSRLFALSPWLYYECTRILGKVGLTPRTFKA